MPTTTASIERSFIAAGQTVSEHRSKILSDVRNDILFLSSTKKLNQILVQPFWS
jgi:hypothetical protein